MLALFVLASIMAANAVQTITGVEKIDIPTKMVEVYVNSTFLVIKTFDGTPTLSARHYAKYNNTTGTLSVTQKTQKATGIFTRGDLIETRLNDTISYGNFTINWKIWTWKNTHTNKTWTDEIVIATVAQKGPYYVGMSEYLQNKTAVTLNYPIYSFHN